MPSWDTEEERFIKDYTDYANKYRLNPNPYNKLHYYDYRNLWDETGGIAPDEAGHLPSKYKLPGHPRQFINGVNTITGEDMNDPYTNWFINPTQEIEEEPIRERLKTDRGLGWYVNRPLMGRNVGSRKGAERFGELMGEGYSGPSAFLRSMPAYARGWKQGLLGEAPDVSGADLFSASDKSLWHDPTQKTEAFKKWWSVPGYEENKWEPSIGGGVGALLDLMDPTLATAPGEAALGKVGAGLAGRYGMWEEALRNPETIGKIYQPLRDLLGLSRKTEIPKGLQGMYDYAGVNIPPQATKLASLTSRQPSQSYKLKVYKPSGENVYKHPKMIIGPDEDITNIMEQFGAKYGIPPSPHPVQGFYFPSERGGKWAGDYIGLGDELLGVPRETKELRKHYGHEMGHLVSAKGSGYQRYPDITELPKGLQENISQLQSKLPEGEDVLDALFNYGYLRDKSVQALREKSPLYEKMSTGNLGEEVFSNLISEYGPEVAAGMLREHATAPSLGKGIPESLETLAKLADELPQYMPWQWKEWKEGMPWLTASKAGLMPTSKQAEQMSGQQVKAGGMPAPMIATQSGKTYPEAYIARSMNMPGELDYLEQLMQAGKKSDVASSIITPTQTQTFHSTRPGQSAGLIFNVNDPENIRFASSQISPPEMSSFDFPVKRESLYPKEAERLAKIRDELMRKYGSEGLENPETNWILADNRLKALGERKEFQPTDYPTLIDLQGQDPLRDLWEKQLQHVSQLPENVPDYNFLNEIGYQMGDPSELAGIRLGSDLEKNKRFMEFGQKYNLPIWELNPMTEKTGVQQGLIDLLSNPPGHYKWLRSPLEGYGPGQIKSSYY